MRHSWLRWGALAGACLLAGCDMAPRFQAPVVAVPDGFQEAGQWARYDGATGAVSADWWRAFGDPVLDRLETDLIRANPTLAAAEASYEQARALAMAAASGLFPQITAGGQINTDRQSARRPRRRPGQANQYLDNVLDTQASYEIDFWDRVANTARTGKALAEASAADLATTRLSLEAELATDYMTYAGLDAELRLLTSTVGTYRQALQLTQNRFAGKIASASDVSRAATELDTAEAAIADARAQRALITHAIAVLVGTPPELLQLPASAQLPQMPRFDAGLPSTLLERRPDIAAAEERVAAANYTIGVARAAYFPNISLNAILGLEDTGFNLFSLRDSFWALGPGLTVPLFEGGLLRAEERAAIANWRLTVADYRQTVLSALADVEDAAALLHDLGDEQNDEERAVADAGKTLDSAMALYRDGATSYLEVVTAQVDELAAQQAVLTLAVRRRAATVALVRAIGGGWTEAALTPIANGPRLAGQNLKSNVER